MFVKPIRKQILGFDQKRLFRRFYFVRVPTLDGFGNFSDGFGQTVEQSLVHGALVDVRRGLDHRPEVKHDLIAVVQNFFQIVVFGQIVFVEMVLTRTLDDLIVYVGDVHHVEDVVAEVVLQNSIETNKGALSLQFNLYLNGLTAKM